MSVVVFAYIKNYKINYEEMYPTLQVIQKECVNFNIMISDEIMPKEKYNIRIFYWKCDAL